MSSASNAGFGGTLKTAASLLFRSFSIQSLIASGVFIRNLIRFFGFGRRFGHGGDLRVGSERHLVQAAECSPAGIADLFELREYADANLRDEEGNTENGKQQTKTEPARARGGAQLAIRQRARQSFRSEH